MADATPGESPMKSSSSLDKTDSRRADCVSYMSASTKDMEEQARKSISEARRYLTQAASDINRLDRIDALDMLRLAIHEIEIAETNLREWRHVEPLVQRDADQKPV